MAQKCHFDERNKKCAVFWFGSLLESVGRSGRWVDGVTNLRKTCCEDKKWIELAEVGTQRWTLVIVVLTFRFYYQ